MLDQQQPDQQHQLPVEMAETPRVMLLLVVLVVDLVLAVVVEEDFPFLEQLQLRHQL